MFFFNDTATTEIYTLSLHDALPISVSAPAANSPPASAPESQHLAEIETTNTVNVAKAARMVRAIEEAPGQENAAARSEEHTSELQSRQYLVCRLLLEKKITSNVALI